MQKNDVGPLPHTIHTNPKWIEDLNGRAKTIKLLEGNLVNFHDLGFSCGFLGRTPKTQATTTK